MTGKIPKAFIDEVLSRTSLVEFIDSHVSLVKRGANYLACCPFHHEKTPSFNVIPNKQFYYCFGCGASGNAISFAMNYLRKDFVASIEDLASRIGLIVPVEAGASPSNNVSYQKIYGFLDEVSQFYYKNLLKDSAAQRYLQQRSLTQPTIDHFQLGFAPDEWQHLSSAFPKQQKALLDTGMLVKNDKGNIYDRYRGRIMFPIHDKRGRVVGFGGRVMDPEHQPKYLNSPETPYFHKSNELYGLHHLQKTSPDTILIVEGYMDVIALYQQGIDNAVATLGTATTQSHIQTLFKTAKTLIFCFDGDKAGRKAASRALNICLSLIHDDETIKFMFLPEGEDPDSLVQKLGKDQFHNGMAEALSLDAFFISELRQEASPHDTAGRSKFIHLAKPLIASMHKGAFKELLLNQLAQITRIDRGRLVTLLEGNEAEQMQTAMPAQPKRHGMPSAMRIAVALLIQAPSLYAKIDIPLNLVLLNQCDNAILIELLRVISKGTETTAQLIEHWRDSEQYPIISKLAILPLSIPEDGQLAELIGSLKKIEKNTLQNKIDGLLYKANAESLSLDEKRLLQRMIKQQKTGAC